MCMHILCCDNRIRVSISYVFYKAEERHDYSPEMCIFEPLLMNMTQLEARRS